jgi:hypothetical protein
VFTKDLDLPLGHRRELVRNRERVYEINGAESRALATIGAFRVIAESHLSDPRDERLSSRETLKHLEREGLIQSARFNSDDRAVTLTAGGRDLLEANRDTRYDRSHEPRQAFYSGLKKPRELTHDTNVYRAYQRAEERIRAHGGQVRRVFSTTSSSGTTSGSFRSGIAAARTPTGDPIEGPRRWPAGRVSTSCRTTTGTCTFPTLASNTKTAMGARVTRISRSSPATTGAPTGVRRHDPDSLGIAPLVAPSAAGVAAGHQTRDSPRNS